MSTFVCQQKVEAISPPRHLFDSAETVVSSVMWKLLLVPPVSSRQG